MHLLRTTSTSLLGATLIATAAAAQDQRLDRLDPSVRPLVASVIDSARAADLVEFRRAVERDIALGAPPGMAVSTAASAAYGAQGLQLDAGARQSRPSRP